MMTTAKQTPSSELPRAIAEAMYKVKHLSEKEYGEHCFVIMPNAEIRDYVGKLFTPLDPKQFHELTGDSENHAKICDVLDEWFSDASPARTEKWKNGQKTAKHVKTLEWYKNPIYLTESGGWRAWWLRAYLQVLRDGGDEK